MAQKRMFSLSVIDTDNFLSMPMSSRLLYYELGMRADDDGFVDNWRKILMFTGLKEDDLKILIARQFIIPFETGVIVIRHWRLNNYLRADRYTQTNYIEEKSQLEFEENGAYSLKNKVGIPLVDTDKNSIDKNRLVEKRKEEKRKNFVKPTIEEIKEYCSERNNGINANAFYDFYESKNWYVGKNKMKDWRACIRTWEQRDTKQKDKLPEWFDKEIKEEEIDDTTQKELNELNDFFKGL